MTVISRRAALVGAMASGMACASPLLAIAGLRLPSGTMRLTRRIERGLGGGVLLTVERAWDVRFIRQGSGCSIAGLQVSVKIDAPASLASLAQIEEARSTDSMWPILLAEDGAILAAGRFVLEQDLAHAVSEARRVIEQRKLAPDAMASQLEGLALLQKSTGRLLDQLPGDLFFPVSGSFATTSPISLGDGLEGEFRLRYEARPAPDAPWLERAERSVLTRVGATERQSREVWTMHVI